MNKLKYLAFSYCLITIYSCIQDESVSETLFHTQEKIKKNEHISYNYESFWENKFNDSEHRDTNYIELEKLHGNMHEFKFHTSSPSYINYFDGITEKEVIPEESRIINHDPKEIAVDSSYFQHRMNFMALPNHFLDIDSSYTSKDTIIENRRVVLFQKYKEEIFDSANIKLISSYAIDKNSNTPWLIKTTAIKDRDTTQIITHYFQDIEFSNKSIDFAQIKNSVSELGYAEIAANQLEMEMEMEQIQVDSKIPTNGYINMYGETSSIFGNPNRKTVMMFSFIGCGGCEYAMKEMKKKNFAFKNDIDFYYSSPLDKSDILKQYLEEKGFIGMGFGKESKMNDHFNANLYPTFFIINSSGSVTDIYRGYRNGFEDEIF